MIKKTKKLAFNENNFKLFLKLFFLASFFISNKLWFGTRELPKIPVLNLENHYIDSGLAFVFLISLLLSFFIKKRSINILSIISLILLLFFDQIRIQPWVYHFILFSIPLLFFRGKKNLSLRLTFYKIIIISTYFWGGISKINNYFISEVSPTIQAFIGLSFENEIGYLIPFLEILIAILFIFNKTKKYGACLAVLNHAFIILWLSFSSINNIVVIPWNLFLIYAITNLFYFNTERTIIEFKSLKEKSTLVYKILAIVLFLLPLLSYFGMLDKHLGFHLYSGNKEYVIIAIEENSALKLTKKYKKYQKKIENTEGGYLIDLNKWSYSELKVPIPPEQRIFKSISQKFCAKEIPKDHLVILIYKGNFKENNFWSYNCSMKAWTY